MFYWKIICIFFVIALFSGCTTGPRLGYPIGDVEIPTQVTLFSIIAKKGTIIQNMHSLAKVLWDKNYREEYEEMFGQVARRTLQEMLNIMYLNKVFSLNDLYTLNPSQVFNWDIDYEKTVEDAKTYSGYDFSAYKDKIPSPYILALTINEWGYMVQREQNKEDGPYIILSIQLIDKETNESIWEYKKMYQNPIGSTFEERNETKITVKFLEKSYKYLITEGVNYFFSRLAK